MRFKYLFLILFSLSILTGAGFQYGGLHERHQTVVSAGGTTTLINTSPQYIFVTGSSTQTIRLPNATTFGVTGHWYVVQNDSTQDVTVINGSGANIGTVSAGSWTKFFPISITTAAGSWEVSSASGASSSPSALRYAISQVAHGFSVGSVVRYTGTVYVAAQADASANSEVLGVVSAVLDADNFTLMLVGHISGLAGLTSGSTYYLSAAVAGAATAIEPTTINQVSKPIYVADSTTSAFVIHSRGVIVTSAGGGGGSVGDVVGPGSATDNALVRFDSTTGKIVQNGIATEDDAGNITATSFVGNASTATALAANPTDCAANTYATTIAANGNLTCAVITNAATTATTISTGSTIVLRDINGQFGNASTATALAANPTDCSAGQFATTIDANGNLTCATPDSVWVPDSSSTFATTGASTFYVPTGVVRLGVVVVGAGGAGGGAGGDSAGGGAGGGVVYATNYPVIAGQIIRSYVGAGGVGSDVNIAGLGGGPSFFGNLVANGGAGGSSPLVLAPIRGNTGGGSLLGNGSTFDFTGSQNALGSSFGFFTGGSGNGTTGNTAGGGGAGADANGTDGVSNVSGGNGGAGASITIFGGTTVYAGGGGGGLYNAGVAGAGANGGGNGGVSGGGGATSGTANTGGGGGGAARTGQTAGSGGSGIIKIYWDAP